MRSACSTDLLKEHEAQSDWCLTMGSWNHSGRGASVGDGEIG